MKVIFVAFSLGSVGKLSFPCRLLSTVGEKTKHENLLRWVYSAGKSYVHFNGCLRTF